MLKKITIYQSKFKGVSSRHSLTFITSSFLHKNLMLPMLKKKETFVRQYVVNRKKTSNPP